MRRGITAEIDLDAALNNLEAIRKTVNGLPVIAVIKADAYGHGAPELARLYEDAEIHSLAVAFVSEAEELRESGIKTTILVLFDTTEPDKYIRHGLTPVIHSLKSAEAFNREAEKHNAIMDVHIKIDTGMGRVGFSDQKEVAKVLEMRNLKVAGLMSHFSEADIADQDFVNLQLKRFNETKMSLSSRGIKPICHMANSAAVFGCPEAHMDAVRPGLVLYGVSPFSDDGHAAPGLRPLMKASVKIVSIRKLDAGHPVSYGRTFVTKRPTLVAVLAVGYADGYARMFSNSAEVLIRGKRAPIIGRVCMDLAMADVTEIDGVTEEDQAVLLGRDGDEEITAGELASKASTIPYEILCELGRNSKRQYSRIPLGEVHRA